jgi:hypothetical protein
MPDDRTGSDTREHRSVGQRMKRSVETHVLVPLAVTVVSAATHYLIKKLPLILEEKVLPKLREQSDTEGARGTVAETAAAVAERVVDVAGIEEGGDGDGAAAPSARPKRRQPSNDEREQERKQREQRRGERRRAVQKA